MSVKNWNKWLNSLSKEERKSAWIIYDALLAGGRKPAKARRLTFAVMNEWES